MSAFRSTIPGARVVGSSLSAARRSVTIALADVELPACFVQATVSAAVNAIDRDTVVAKASRRRLTDKATRLAGVSS